MRAHCYDAFVGIAGCDKSLPGMMMAMARLNVPAIFLYGGTIMPGHLDGKDLTVQDVYEAVGSHAAGKLSDAGLKAVEENACPGAGSCGGQFTANTMACVAEAIGLALPGSSAIPAEHPARATMNHRYGQAIVDLLKAGILPRDILTKKAFENAVRIVAATGGSTNTVLHMPALAHECGFEVTLKDIETWFNTTPYFVDLKPGGRFVMWDVYQIGGVPVILKALLEAGYLHGDCLTVTGKTQAENLKDVQLPTGQDVMVPVTAPLSAGGGLKILFGNMAPEGAVVKTAGLTKLVHRGKAKVYNGEQDCFAAIVKNEIVAGDVVIIRYEGPKGGPGMQEMLYPTTYQKSKRLGKVCALMTDERVGSLSSGMHHASFGSGSGYCTFNGLAAAIRAAIDTGVQRILCLDYDAHAGGGTWNIMQKLFPESVVQVDVTVSAFDTWTPSGDSRLDIVEPSEYRAAIAESLDYASSLSPFDLVIYNAGVDIRNSGVSEADLRAREKMVSDFIGATPAVFGLAGGYTWGRYNIDDVVGWHRLTINEWAKPR
jgi:dihydroxy-acid dehydratase